MALKMAGMMIRHRPQVQEADVSYGGAVGQREMSESEVDRAMHRLLCHGVEGAGSDLTG